MQNYSGEMNNAEYINYNSQPQKIRLRIVKRNNADEPATPQPSKATESGEKEEQARNVTQYAYSYDQIVVEECKKTGVCPYEARKVARGIERNVTRARQLGLRLFRKSFKSLAIVVDDYPSAPVDSVSLEKADVPRRMKAEAKYPRANDYVYKHDLFDPRECADAKVSQRELHKVARGMERYVGRARELGVRIFAPCAAGLGITLAPERKTRCAPNLRSAHGREPERGAPRQSHRALRVPARLTARESEQVTT
jgi:hypothetical protein